jgi:AraC-like DNA-binding protein
MDLHSKPLPAFFFYALAVHGTHIAGFEHPHQLCNSPFPRKLLEILETKHSEANFKVSDLDQLYWRSPMQVYRKIKQFTGLSPRECLLYYRLSKALHLIITTDRTISDIAYDTGFGSPSSFTRAFVRTIGRHPGDFRKEQAQDLAKMLGSV